ncbi:hypothetical protein GQ607_011933 [Colletotrichum asianum]|uniref:Uncharacterized protein n=1 Tax=Colletotrichum asianum TaxID=702518 RepID=A0A8H3W6A8_9PEZI|nr:hypothetical protein GQ607_011933 [Colletotrichum asianum]
MGRNAPGPSGKVSKCYAAGASGWRLLYPYERNICGGALANAATLLQIQPHEVNHSFLPLPPPITLHTAHTTSDGTDRHTNTCTTTLPLDRLTTTSITSLAASSTHTHSSLCDSGPVRSLPTVPPTLALRSIPRSCFSPSHTKTSSRSFSAATQLTQKQTTTVLQVASHLPSLVGTTSLLSLSLLLRALRCTASRRSRHFASLRPRLRPLPSAVPLQPITPAPVPCRCISCLVAI